MINLVTQQSVISKCTVLVGQLQTRPDLELRTSLKSFSFCRLVDF